MEKKENILIVHNYYQIPGGEDTVVTNEKKLLEDNGHEVVLYTRHNEELNNLSFLQKLLLPFTTVFSLKTYREVKKIIKQEKIDILHVHNTLNLISPSVYYAGFSCKIPVVQTVHNFRFLCPSGVFYRDNNICEDCVDKGLKCAVKHKCYRNSLSQTIALTFMLKFHRILNTYKKLNYICLTEFNKEKLLKLKQIDKNKVFVKPNFIIKNNNQIIPYDKRFNQYVFAGRLDKLKGIDVLLNTWKILGNDAPSLIICGTGPMEDWCKDYITDNNLKNVQMKGFVTNEQVKKIIALSKAVILPTQWYEGFPMNIVEAYSKGTVVLGSDIGNVGNIISSDSCKVKFKQNSAKDLANTVKEFEKCDMQIESDKVYHRFLNEFSDEKNYEVLSGIYENTI